MRYKRQKISIITLFDGDVNDDDIGKILNSLALREMDVRIRLKGEFVTSPSRIVFVKEDMFQYEIIGRGCLKRNAKHQDVEYLEVISNDEFTCEVKPGVTRWNLLNPMDPDFFE